MNKKRLTKNQVELLAFLERSKGWNSIDGSAVRTARSLDRRGLIEFLDYSNSKHKTGQGRLSQYYTK